MSKSNVKKSQLRSPFMPKLMALVMTSTLLVEPLQSKPMEYTTVNIDISGSKKVFRISPRYLDGQTQSSNILIIYALYPSLEPPVSSGPEAMQLRITVSGLAGSSRAEGLQQRAYPSRNFSSAREYHAGQDDGYDVFKANSLKTGVETYKAYLFKGGDGEKVLIEEGLGVTNIGYRRFDKNLDVRYQFPKALPSDWRALDAKVCELIATFLQK